MPLEWSQEQLSGSLSLSHIQPKIAPTGTSGFFALQSTGFRFHKVLKEDVSEIFLARQGGLCRHHSGALGNNICAADRHRRTSRRPAVCSAQCSRCAGGSTFHLSTACDVGGGCPSGGAHPHTERNRGRPHANARLQPNSRWSYSDASGRSHIGRAYTHPNPWNACAAATDWPCPGLAAVGP